MNLTVSKETLFLINSLGLPVNLKRIEVTVGLYVGGEGIVGETGDLPQRSYLRYHLRIAQKVPLLYTYKNQVDVIRCLY